MFSCGYFVCIKKQVTALCVIRLLVGLNLIDKMDMIVICICSTDTVSAFNQFVIFPGKNLAIKRDIKLILASAHHLYNSTVDNDAARNSTSIDRSI